MKKINLSEQILQSIPGSLGIMNAKKTRVFGTVIVILSGTYSSTTNVSALILPSLTEVGNISAQGALLPFITISLAVATISLGTGLSMFGNDRKSIRVSQLHLLSGYGILTISLGIVGLIFPGTIIMILSGFPLIIFGVLLIASDILMKVTNKDDFNKDS